MDRVWFCAVEMARMLEVLFTWMMYKPDSFVDELFWWLTIARHIPSSKVTVVLPAALNDRRITRIVGVAVPSSKVTPVETRLAVFVPSVVD